MVILGHRTTVVPTDVQLPGAGVGVDNLTASATELTLAPPSTIPNAENFQGFQTEQQPQGLEYERINTGSGNIDSYVSLVFTITLYGWGAISEYPPGLSLGRSTWIIATVATRPEPGTFTLALLGGACVGAVMWMRRCRRAASGPDR
jgi:hypothetical protein